MLTLKQINCSIELGPGNTKLKEYGARYSDGHVEAFVAVAHCDVPFTIHLESEGYIAPGLAFFVFMDGEYQCNRNRVGLKLPGEGVQPREYETEFRVRQKEEKTSLGTFVVRDWTFTKLNRVAADKAPNLNPQFTNNVGSIEIVVLRCTTEVNDPPQKASRGKDVDHVQPANVAKRGPTAKPIRSARSTAAPESEIGGLFGLFDGAHDAPNLVDSASDQPVGPGGRVRPMPPPGMGWDSAMGMFVPQNCLHAKTEANCARDLRSVIANKFNLVEADTVDAKAQLDGHDGQPAVVLNQWDGRGRDDMRVDKLLGLQGRDRSAYKQRLREAGEAVSTSTKRFPDNYRDFDKFSRLDNHPQFDNYPRLYNYSRFNERQSYGQPEQAQHQEPAWNEWLRQNPPRSTASQPHIPLELNPREIAEEIDRMGQRVHDFIQQHTDREEPKAQQEMAMLTNLRNLQQRGYGSLECFPHWLLEVLIDMEVRRQYVLRLIQRYPRNDFSQLSDRLDNERMEALRDPLYHRQYRIDDLEECLAMYFMLHERVEALTEFLKNVAASHEISADDIRMRLDYVRMQRDKANDTVDELERQAEPRNEARQPHALGPEAQDRRTFHPPAGYPRYGNIAQGEGDGTPYSSAWPNAPAHGNSWQQVGAGTWHPEQRFHQYQTRPTNGQTYGGQQKASVWNAGPDQNDWTHEGPRDGDGQQQHDWGRDQKSNRGASAWGGNQNGGDQSNGNKTHEHDFGGPNDGWDASKSQRSSRKNNNDNFWSNNDNNQQQAGDDQGWGGQSASHNTADINWGNGSQQSQKAKSIRSVATATRAVNKDSSAHIKPYWRDWNKPFDRIDSSDPNRKKKRDDPREAYRYPESPLPAVADKTAKGATHGIQVSRGADYSHMCRKPTYIDSMERPYAVFSFKYRSKEALEKILKLKIDEVDMKRIQTELEQDRLMAMPKHKLIEQLMEKRAPSKSVNNTASNRNSKPGGWDDSGGDHNASDGWVNKGGRDNAANNAWDNGNDGWTNQDGQSNRSQHNASRNNDRQSHGSRKPSITGWTPKAPSKNGAKNDWDNSPAEGFAGW